MRVRVPHQVLADAVDVLRDHGIIHQLDLRFDLLGIRPAHRHLPFNAVPVAHTPTASHVAVSHRIHVGLGAIVLDLAVLLGGQRSRRLGRQRFARRLPWAGLYPDLELELGLAFEIVSDLGSAFDRASDREFAQAVFVPTSKAQR